MPSTLSTRISTIRLNLDLYASSNYVYHRLSIISHYQSLLCRVIDITVGKLLIRTILESFLIYHTKLLHLCGWLYKSSSFTYTTEIYEQIFQYLQWAYSQSLILWMALFSWVLIFVDWTEITRSLGSKFVAIIFSFILHTENRYVMGTGICG